MTQSLRPLLVEEREDEALRAAYGRINAILEQINDGFVSYDRDWRYTHVNAAAAKSLQMTPEQLLGKTIWEKWPPTYDLPIGVNFRRSLQENIPIQFETYYPAPLDRWFEFRCFPTTEGLATFFSDITDRKQAEEELQKAHYELKQRVAEQTEELVITINFLQNEIVERERAEKSLRKETAERLRVLEELREKDSILMQQTRLAAMGEMIGHIAHQWRQPLNTLGLIIQQAPLYYELGRFNKEFLDDNVKKAMDLIQHMSRTIDDFRNYFKPDKQKVEFKLYEAVKKNLLLMKESFLHQKISMEVDVQSDLVIYGYENEFSQALLNILINARDALMEREVDDPRVIIHICAEGNKAVLTITDNAGGISDEVMGKIFDPYFTTKGPQTGTGVGLFMSKAIIEKNMGGRLSARNTGNGAEFRIEV